MDALFGDLRASFAWYSQTNLFGIEGDFVAHLVVGTLLFLAAIHAGYRRPVALMMVFFLAFTKECLDSTGLKYVLANSLADLAFTMLGPFVLSLTMPEFIRQGSSRLSRRIYRK